jgi:hypothetical protein
MEGTPHLFFMFPTVEFKRIPQKDLINLEDYNGFLVK